MKSKKYRRQISPQHQVLKNDSTQLHAGCVSERCFQQSFGRHCPCEGCPLAEVLKTKQPKKAILQPFSDLSPLAISLEPVLDEDGEIVSILEEISLAAVEKKVPEASTKEMIRVREERRRLQQHALKKHLEVEEIERNTESQKEFLRLAAHQRQTPISILRGYLELFLADPSKQNYVNLDQTLVELSELVQNMMLFAHAAPTVEDLEKVDVVAETQKNTQNFQQKYPEHLVSFSSPHGVGEIWGMASRQRGKHILTALLENSVKYSSPGTKIEVSVEATADKIKISVYDEGAGIPEEEQEKIFEPFFRGSRRVQGSGLGLSIVRKLIRSRGGDVVVKSVFGEFTKITILLPRNIPEKSLTEEKNLGESAR